MPDRKWLVPTVAGLALAFVLGQAFLPFANAFSFLQYPGCALRSGWDTVRTGTSVNAAADVILRAATIDAEVARLTEERDDIMARRQNLRSERLVLQRMIESARLDCAAREDCDPDRFTPDTVMDSYLLPGPRSLSDFDRSLDSAIEEHSGIVSEIDEVQATRPATGAERDRLTRFFDLPQACVSLLMTDKRRRAGAVLGLHQTND
jgi:hypothetical protein